MTYGPPPQLPAAMSWPVLDESVIKDSEITDLADYIRRNASRITPLPTIRTSRAGINLSISPSITPEAWADKVVLTYPTQTTSASSETMQMVLPPDMIDHYVELQRALAKRFPLESSRPNIYLTIKGSRAPSEGVLGILGGVGPLSDADMLKHAFDELENSDTPTADIEIRLYSNPHPPRSFWDYFKFSTWQYFFSSFFFLRQPDVDQYMVASNTAHLHYKLLDGIATSPFYHGVNEISKAIDDDTPETERVLVLGTTQAYKGKLYPKSLAALGLDILTPSLQIQTQLQEAIDAVKEGRLEEARKSLLALIKELANLDRLNPNTRPLTHLLLGCTELPLVLKAEDVREAVGYDVSVVDSKQIFAKHIVAFFRSRVVRTRSARK